MNIETENTSNRPPVKRVGMVVESRPEHTSGYRRLHADGHPGVRDLLSKYLPRDFPIFLHEVAGRRLELGSHEYHGENFEADMAALAAEQRNQEWLARCDPLQAPLEGETGWAFMERVCFNP